MGTIFTHKITNDEIRKLRKMIPGRNIADETDYENFSDSDIKYADLFRLYSIRGEREKAQIFFDKIKDRTLKYLLKEVNVN